MHPEWHKWCKTGHFYVQIFALQILFVCEQEIAKFRSQPTFRHIGKGRGLVLHQRLIWSINHVAFAKWFRCAGRDCCRCSLKAECSKRRCCQPEQVAARTVAVIMGAGYPVAVVCNLVRLVVCCYCCYTVHWITFGSLGQKLVLCVPLIAMLCSWQVYSEYQKEFWSDGHHDNTMVSPGTCGSWCTGLRRLP